jgi:hypothetical protein
LSRGRSGPDASGVIEFIQKTCYIPEGRKVGEPLKLAKFQKEIIRAIYDNDVPTRRAIISMGRKNAKTSLSACLLLNHLCGPSAAERRNSQLYSTAQSREQAGNYFLAGGEDRAAVADPAQCGACSRQRQGAAVPCARDQVPGAVGRGDDGVWIGPGLLRSR